MLEKFGILTNPDQTTGYSLSGGERRRRDCPCSLAATSFMLLDRTVREEDRPYLDYRHSATDKRSQGYMGIGDIITDHNVRETPGYL